MSILTVAHTGSGKTKSLILPNLATYTGGVICLDVSGEHTPKQRATGKRWAKSLAVRFLSGKMMRPPLTRFLLCATPCRYVADAEKLAAVFAPTGDGSRVFGATQFKNCWQFLSVLYFECDSHEQEATPKNLMTP